MLACERRHGSSILDRIGNAPLVRLDRLTAHLSGVQILGKAEWLNPSESIKDRAASSIVAAAQASGRLTPGKFCSMRPRETPALHINVIVSSPQEVNVHRRA
jgi:threonine synthase